MKNHSFKALNILFFLSLWLSACSSEKEMQGTPPAQMLSQSEMVEVLTDMQAAEGTVAIKQGGNLNTKTAQKNKFQQAILAKHGISQQVFWENYQYYSENPQILDTIYAQVIQKLEKQMPIERERMAKNPPPAPIPNPAIPAKPQIVPPNSTNKAGKNN